MHKRVKNGLVALAAVLLFLLLLILSGAVALNLSLLKESVSRLVKDSTGLLISVSGPLHLRLGLHPQLQVSGLELMSGDGASHLLRLAGLDTSLELAGLLSGQLSFDKVIFNGLVLDVCVPMPILLDEESSDDSPAFSVALQALDGRDIAIRCSGGSPYLPAQVDTVSGTAIKGEDIALAADVRWQGRQFGLGIAAAPLDELLYSPKPQALMLSVTTEFGELELDAEIQDLLNEPKIQADVNALFDQPDMLLALFGTQTEGLQPIAMQGRIGMAGDQLSVEGLSGYFGGATWSLSGLLDWGKQRPLLLLDAQLDELDIDTLPLSAPPSTNKSPDLVDLHDELALQLLDIADARIDLRLGQLRVQPAPPADVVLRMEIEAGQAQFDIFKLHTSLGSAVGQITLDRNQNCPAWETSATLSGLDLGEIGRLTGLDQSVVATLATSDIVLNACGNTLHGIRESLELTADIKALKIQPLAGLPLVGIDVATLTSGWRRPSVLEATLSIDEQAFSGRVEVGEMALLEQDPDWPVRLKLVSGEAELGVNGLVRFNQDQFSAAADVSLRASRSGPILSLAGFDPRYQGKIALDLHADVDDQLVRISGFKAALGNSDLEGSLELALADKNRMSDLVLRSRFLDVEELQQIFASQNSASQSGGESLDLGWPQLRLDLAFADVHGLERDITNLSLTGSLRDKRIEDARLALEVPAFSLLGQLSADFSTATPSVFFDTTIQDIDLDSVIRALELDLELAPDVDVSAKEMQLHLSSSGAEWQELAHNLELDFTLRQLVWKLAERWPGDDFQLKVSEATGRARPELPVTLTLVGALDKFPVNGWVQLGPAHQLLDPHVPLPVRVVLGTDRETLMLNASIERANETGLEATVQLSAIARVLALSEFETLHAPLPGLIVNAEIDTTQGDVQTVVLAAELRDSRVEGSVVARLEGERTLLEIGLDSPYLQTVDFSPLIAAFNDESAAAEASASGAANPSRFLEVLDEYLGHMPEMYDFEIATNIDELVAGEYFLGAATLYVSIEQQDIELGILKLSSPRGEVEVNYALDTIAKGLYSKLDAHITDFELGGLLKTLDPKSNSGGKLYVDMSLEATAAHLQEMQHTVSGHFDLALFPRDINADVLDLWTNNLIFALVPIADDDHKQINCLVSRFEVEDGIMHSKSILLDSTDVIIHGKGDINLGERELDLIFAPQAKRERFLSVSSPMAVTGPFEDFRVGMAGAGLAGTVFRWYLSLVSVPLNWLTGERFPADGRQTCVNAMEWQSVSDNSTLTPE